MMLSYKKYFLEYYKGDELTNPRMSNTKDPHIDPSERVHANATKQEYKHKHPIIDNITSGRANNVSMKGQVLIDLLNTFNTHFESGISKSLGNSNVEANMYEDEQGMPCAILKRKPNTNPNAV